MNGTSDVKTEVSLGAKEKSKSGIKKKGSKKKSSKTAQNKEIPDEDKKPPENTSSNQGPDESKKGNFEGDFFKDFYYAQGDYKAEEAEEVEELKHAIDIENEEPK